MAYDIEQIEDAVVNLLQPLKQSGVRTIATVQEELTEDSLKRLAAQPKNQLPAVFVVYSGSHYQSHGRRKVETLILSLFVVTRSLQNDQEALRGGANIGTYTILREIRDLLTGQLLLPEMLPVEIQSEESIWRGNGLSLYGAAYSTGQTHLYP